MVKQNTDNQRQAAWAAYDQVGLVEVGLISRGQSLAC
jgi:hypothetical protein